MITSGSNKLEHEQEIIVCDAINKNTEENNENFTLQFSYMIMIRDRSTRTYNNLILDKITKWK